MSVFTVRHLTTYRYKRPVAFGAHRMMLRPRDGYDQTLLAADLKISPQPTRLRWMDDVFGNAVTIAEFDAIAETLSFESNIRLEQSSLNAPDFAIEDYARSYPFAYDEEEMPDLAPYIARQFPDVGREIADWVTRFLHAGGPTDTGRLLMTLTYAIRESFVYERRLEQGTWNPGLTLRMGRGSCRDLALLMIEAVRSLGFAARFVSGYLYVPRLDPLDYRGGGSTHAWCQVYLPGAGWVEFDPTNGIVGSNDLIRVAVARDPRQAIPLSGSFQGAAEDVLGMEVEVQVDKVSNGEAAPAPGTNR
jgi:transglutaminase-like putative cysteine protease